MSKKLIAIGSALAMTLLSVSSANAAIINLVPGDAYYVGVVINGIPSSDAREPQYLNDLIALAPGAIDAAPTGCNSFPSETCSREGSPAGLVGLPTVELTGNPKTGVGNDLLSGNVLVNGWEYISGKYGNEGIRYWYIGGLATTDFVTLPTHFSPTVNGGGLSHYTLYNAPRGRITNVPDGGATAALLGLSLVGLGIIRRRINL